MKNILLCVDSSSATDPVVETAFVLAQNSGSAIHLIHVDNLNTLMRLAGTRNFSSNDLDGWKNAWAELRSLQCQLLSADIEALIVTPDELSLESMVGAIAALDVDLVLMADSGSTGFRQPLPQNQDQLMDRLKT